MPGLDADYGLRVLGGTVLRYRVLLGRAVDAAEHDLATLSATLARGDLAAARRVVHSMQGTVGTVGAKGLVDRLTDLSRVLKTDEALPQAGRLLGEVQDDLAALAAAVRELPQG
ncbi:MAG: Hpt domain-containing protein [Rubrivivax sp.]